MNNSDIEAVDAVKNLDLAKELEERRTKEYFRTIRQGTATNTLAKLKPTKKNTTVDAITGEGTITKGSFTLKVPGYADTKGLKTSAHQLLDALVIELTETGAKSPTVLIPLSKYMEQRGLKNRQTAKEQANSDMKILQPARIEWTEKRGKKTEHYAFINIADSGEVKKNGDIVFTFGNSFFDVLKGYAVMAYPKQLFRLNNRLNPNSYYLLRKIAEHKNMNVGKKNEDIISVKTLLAAAPYIPSYAEVEKTDRRIGQRIIEPFERDMDAFNETLQWEYCHSKGEPITDEEAELNDYETFSRLMVHITWRQYPDQTARLERKAERIEAAKEAKKKRDKAKPKTEKP